MLMTLAKALVTAAFIVLVSEIAKRSTLAAAILVALPLATMMTVGLTYLDTRDAELSTRFATTTFFLIWPGLLFFITLPTLQKWGAHFWLAYGVSVFLAVAGYTATILILRRIGITL
ncbi:MAG: hypothetical protein GVY06_08745 [Alphaproteobacteria bacterium]|nr:hypothetical protein [Alphaproteobacteria bacterium]